MNKGSVHIDRPLRRRRVLVPAQPTDSDAWAEAFTPFAGPGAPGLSTVICRSSTVAEFPAASITLTTR